MPMLGILALAFCTAGWVWFFEAPLNRALDEALNNAFKDIES